MKESAKPVAQRQAVSFSADRSAGSGPKGVALQPPTYGIDLADRPAPRRENRTGLPDRLKDGIEVLSGLSMDAVRVHYNSDKPARLNALAYTQGTEIHVRPGQEGHLGHEAWHVVQQAQGRVRATARMKGVRVNDDPELEREADSAGGKAAVGNLVPIQGTDPFAAFSAATVTQRQPSNDKNEATEKKQPNTLSGAPGGKAACIATSVSSISQIITSCMRLLAAAGKIGGDCQRTSHPLEVLNTATGILIPALLAIAGGTDVLRGLEPWRIEAPASGDEKPRDVSKMITGGFTAISAFFAGLASPLAALVLKSDNSATPFTHVSNLFWLFGEAISGFVNASKAYSLYRSDGWGWSAVAGVGNVLNIAGIVLTSVGVQIGEAELCISDSISMSHMGNEDPVRTLGSTFSLIGGSLITLGTITALAAGKQADQIQIRGAPHAGSSSEQGLSDPERSAPGTRV